jgi:hypothetical protein
MTTVSIGNQVLNPPEDENEEGARPCTCSRRTQRDFFFSLFWGSYITLCISWFAMCSWVVWKVEYDH